VGEIAGNRACSLSGWKGRLIPVEGQVVNKVAVKTATKETANTPLTVERKMFSGDGFVFGSACVFMIILSGIVVLTLVYLPYFTSKYLKS
jgi:hypothetical protein